MQSNVPNGARSTSSLCDNGVGTRGFQRVTSAEKNYAAQPILSLQQSAKARVLIVHNLPLVRFGLAKLIEASKRFTVCSKTGHAPTARELFVRDQPQLIILGLTLTGGDGIELIKDFRKLNPVAKAVVFSTRRDHLSIDRAFRAGAHGYLLASESTAEILDALNHIGAGHFYASRAALERIIENRATDKDEPCLENLSDRELQVLSLIGRGFGASRLAHELNLSVKTIETYQMHLKEKLGLCSASELSKAASEWMTKSVRRNLQSRNATIIKKGRCARAFLYSC